MNINPVIDAYNDNQEEIQGIFRSRLIVQILLALGNGDKSLAELREITGSSSQAIIPKIRMLESMNYIESLKEGYSLTVIGDVLEKEIEKLVTIIGISDSKRDFWCNHDTRPVPPEFLERIGDLYNSEIMRDVDDNILSVYSLFLKILNEAEAVYAVSSIMSPAHAEAIKNTVLRDIHIDLIVTPDIIKTMTDEPYISIMRSISDHEYFRVYVYPENIRIGMTVTDKFLSFGLYSLETGCYDSSADLTSTDEKALEWGRNLFEHYKSKSKEFSFT
jgi:predicted transcriptional regulator